MRRAHDEAISKNVRPARMHHTAVAATKGERADFTTDYTDPHFFVGAAVGISITVGLPMVTSPSRARLTMTSDSSMSRPK